MPVDYSVNKPYRTVNELVTLCNRMLQSSWKLIFSAQRKARHAYLSLFVRDVQRTLRSLHPEVRLHLVAVAREVLFTGDIDTKQVGGMILMCTIPHAMALFGESSTPSYSGSEYHAGSRATMDKYDRWRGDRPGPEE